MSGKPQLYKSPLSKEALTTALISMVEQSATVDAALHAIVKHLISLDLSLVQSTVIVAVRNKACEAAAQRRLTVPFELRWRLGGGEIVRGWDALAKRLKDFELQYRVSSLKVLLSGDKQIALALTNDETGMPDVFTIRRIKEPKAKRGRPLGATAKKQATNANRIAALTNPTGNKLRDLTYDTDGEG